MTGKRTFMMSRCYLYHTDWRSYVFAAEDGCWSSETCLYCRLKTVRFYLKMDIYIKLLKYAKETLAFSQRSDTRFISKMLVNTNYTISWKLRDFSSNFLKYICVYNFDYIDAFPGFNTLKTYFVMKISLNVSL